MAMMSLFLQMASNFELGAGTGGSATWAAMWRAASYSGSSPATSLG